MNPNQLKITLAEQLTVISNINQGSPPYIDQVFVELYNQGLLTSAVSSYRRGNTGRSFDRFGSIIKK